MGNGVAVCVNCGSMPTIRAHLFPKAFCRKIGVDADGRPEDFALIDARTNRYSPIKTGIVDSKILCARCDGKIGKLDNYAFLWSTSTYSRFVAKQNGKAFTRVVVDGEPSLILLFALSVLWRFLVSKRPEAGPISAGPYAERIRAILFDAAPIGSNIDCVVHAAKVPVFGSENSFHTPIPIDNEWMRGFLFYLNGFEYIIRLGVERKPFFAGQDPKSWWLGQSSKITLPILPYVETRTGRDHIKLIERNHPGIAYSVRDKSRLRS